MQFLPEVENVFEQLRGKKRENEVLPERKDWQDFLSLTKRIDQLIEREKEKIDKSSPPFLRKSLIDAINAKKNNDRAWCGYVSCLATGGEPENFLPVILAFELIDFSVILIDDILDKAEKRGNMPAHYIKWGETITLTISELLKSISTQLIIDSPLDDKKKLRILREIQNMQRKIYEGQGLDLQFEKKGVDNVREKDYIKLVSLTTGYQGCILFRIGGILANADDRDIDLLGEIGLDLGILCQMRDDLLDYIQDENITWKTPFLDFRRKKKRLPLIVGWRNATREERRKIIKLHKKEKLTDGDYMTITSILFKPKNLIEIREIMQRFKETGIKKVDNGKFTPEGRKFINMVFRFEFGEKI